MPDGCTFHFTGNFKQIGKHLMGGCAVCRVCVVSRVYRAQGWRKRNLSLAMEREINELYTELVWYCTTVLALAQQPQPQPQQF